MAKLLLTSSQVSVVVSSVVVVLTTFALFLSGYVLQQRTLNELRIAIKPRERPSPRVYLPEQFKAELEAEIRAVIEGNTEGEETGEQIIEVQPTEPEDEPRSEDQGDTNEVNGEEASQGEDRAKEDVTGEDVTDEQTAVIEEIQPEEPQVPWAVEHPDPSVKNKKPISAAQRRKLIKDEIRRLSQSDKSVYYQRRLW